MHIRVFAPKLESVVLAITMFCTQTVVFFAGVYVLWRLYNPTPAGADTMSSSLYPYVGFEVAVFLLSTVAVFFAFSCFPFKRTVKQYSLLFFSEILAFIAVLIISTPFGNVCSALVSTSHFSSIAKPICGVSSFNLFTPWFVVFSFVTLSLWSLLLTKNNGSFVEFAFSAKREK